MMKRLTLHAVRSFEREVKEGKRTALSEDELREVIEEGEEGQDDVGEGIKREEDVKQEDEEEDEDDHEGDDTKAKKQSHRFKGKGKSRVKQTKLIIETSRVDPLTGKGRSRGYGFVEMHNHADALRFLRWANNNPEVLVLFEQWWKDEVKEMIRIEKEKRKGKKQEAPEDSTNATRLKRLEDELARAEGGEGKKASGKGTLIVEFSIENIQVVRRRAAQV
jgi:nucleolar protein 4